MRTKLFPLVVLCTFMVLVAAWTKEDYEIFRLRDEVEVSEGLGTTFYEFLGIPPSASHEDIVKAQRKKSRTLHPDKVKQSFIAAHSTGKAKKKAGEKSKPKVRVSKGPSQREIQAAVKKATERYQCLTVVANILKGEGRERYDFFLKNGFPKWRGSNYYYTRFRPGLGSVLLGLFLVGGGAGHYGVLVLSWKRQREFMGRYIRQARKLAWGDETGISGIPGIDGPVVGIVPPPVEERDSSTSHLNRRQKRQMEKENKREKSGKGAKVGGRVSGTETPPPAASVTPTGERRRVVAENGKVLVVDSIGNVFLEEEDEDGNVQEFLLDVNEIARPTIQDTAVYRLPLWIYSKAIGQFQKGGRPPPPSSSPKEDAEPKRKAAKAEVEEDEHDSGSSFEMLDSTAINQAAAAANGAPKKRNKKSKAS